MRSDAIGLCNYIAVSQAKYVGWWWGGGECSLDRPTSKRTWIFFGVGVFRSVSGTDANEERESSKKLFVTN